MASRPELVEMAKELGLSDYIKLSNSELTEKVRNGFDTFFEKKKGYVGDSDISELLLRFVTEEYKYYLFDVKGNLLNYKLNKVHKEKEPIYKHESKRHDKDIKDSSEGC